MSAPATPKLRVAALSKRYPNGVLANDAVSLEVAAGRVHGVLGENGAGKSTLMKMLYGLERPDAGAIELDGTPLRLRGPADAIAAGIGLVPQHLQLVGSMTVAENVVLGDEPLRGLRFDRARAEREVRALAERWSLAVDPAAGVAGLSIGERQRVEILKTLRRGARLLLLDEPSALLSPPEAQRLFGALAALVRAGLTLVLITHKMAELCEFCDDFTVLRTGRVAGAGRVREHAAARIAEMIVGRPLEPRATPRAEAPVVRAAAAPLVRVRGLSLARAQGRPALDALSFDIAAGEILGIAGVEGNGQDKLAELLCGAVAPTAGSAEIDGRGFVGRGVRHARALGVGCIAEDRLHGGLAPQLSVADNAAALDYFAAPLSRRGVLDPAALRRRARGLIDAFGIRARDESVAVTALSGGNMQKLLVGRELAARPRLLIASQPTRGVDLGAAQTLRRALAELRDGGAALLLISADLDELFELADRIAVLFEGRLVACFDAGTADAQAIGRCMTGMRADSVLAEPA
ncbi:MAG TPA: ABC transporter ATP-binding protein [Methylibium sp.]|uniref:ABC transporter ATP-binding protein n=1 Tax=Methylibium sp. TaxID=2067992 RepID=UPI002DBDFCEC|nr:ABC transporter ATP-binding protein [Methylibium sp.]HEU4460276.1 ABC transporter ATP-binding protein [Methylibium sp.]